METSYKIVEAMFKTKILRSDEYSAIMTAKNLLEVATRESEAIVKSSNNIYNIQKAKGYKDGSYQFQQECILKSIELTSNIINSLERFEKEITDVVISCVRKVISEYRPNEALIAMIKNAVQSINAQKNIILKMSEEQINLIGNKITEVNKKFPGVVIELSADNSIPMGDCILVSDFCTVRTGIKTYLDAFEEKVNKKFDIDEK